MTQFDLLRIVVEHLDAASAMKHRHMFKIIDNHTGWKVDLIVRKSRPLSEAEFARRVPVELGGVHVYLASLEDTILAKLEWAATSGSERQLRDVEAMIAVQTPDWAYLEQWQEELGVTRLLQDVRAGTNPWGRETDPRE